MLLSLALAAAVTVIALALIRLEAANTRIGNQDLEIEEQQDLIDKKETFGAAMEILLDTAESFAGVKTASVVPFERFETVAASAWTHRWDAATLTRDITTVENETAGLTELLATAGIEATTNGTGSVYETITDQLGRGFVTTLVDDARALCGDVLACVFSGDPYAVHFDAAASGEPHMNDFLRTGVAYHEMAHVLQFTNPEPTKIAVAAFGGDVETMADCFALTYLDGWSLNHRVYINRYEYWIVDIGYGYTCNDAQKQVIRDWYEPLGFQVTPISQ